MRRNRSYVPTSSYQQWSPQGESNIFSYPPQQQIPFGQQQLYPPQPQMQPPQSAPFQQPQYARQPSYNRLTPTRANQQSSPGQNVTRWQMFPYRFIKPYSAPEDISDKINFLNVLEPRNCEWFRRPGIAASFCAQAVQQNMPLVNMYEDSVYDQAFIHQLNEHIGPIVPTLARLNNRDTEAGKAEIGDVDKLLEFTLNNNINELDSLLVDSIQASSSLLVMASHLRAAIQLCRNPGLYAEKVSSEDNSHQQFANTKSVVDMRDWFLTQMLPLSATRIQPRNLFEQIRASKRSAGSSSQRQRQSLPIIGQPSTSGVRDNLDIEDTIPRYKPTSSRDLPPYQGKGKSPLIQRKPKSTSAVRDNSDIEDPIPRFKPTSTRDLPPYQGKSPLIQRKPKRSVQLESSDDEDNTVYSRPSPSITLEPLIHEQSAGVTPETVPQFVQPKPKKIRKKIDAKPKKASKVKAGSLKHFKAKLNKATSKIIVFDSDTSQA